MEGAQGPNIAQISSMQQHAAQEEDENINFITNSIIGKLFDPKLNPLSSMFGNLDQVAGSFLNQSLNMGGVASFMGQKPWAGLVGINFLGKQSMFNINAGVEEVVGHSDQQPEYHDPGMDMANAGMQYSGGADYIQPPTDTPMMDNHPMLDHSGGMAAR